jgi:uncharacterized protein YecT (DUF1311 family)
MAAMRRVLFAMGVLAASSTSALAADDLSQVCNPETNVAMTQCVTEHALAADKQLNALWPQVLKKVEAADYLGAAERKAWRDKLVSAERAWATFKDDDCKGAMAFEWYGGSGAGAAMGTCLYEKTTARIADLKARYLDN